MTLATPAGFSHHLPDHGESRPYEHGSDSSGLGGPFPHDGSDKSRRNGRTVHGVGVHLQRENRGEKFDQHIGDNSEQNDPQPGGKKTLFVAGFGIEETTIDIQTQVDTRGKKKGIPRGNDESRNGSHAKASHHGGHTREQPGGMKACPASISG